MKKLIVPLLAGFMAMTFTCHAATRGDVKILEASDTIKYRINHLTQNYLLYTLFPHKRELSRVLKRDLEALNKSFQEIAVTTKDAHTRGLLAFFAYQKTRAEAILEQKPTRKLAEEVLDMSESLTEGADAIARHHKYDFSFEEKMFKITLMMSEHLEAIAKYYIAHHLDQSDPEILKKMSRTIKVFADELARIQQYKYKETKAEEAQKSLVAAWQTISPYLIRDLKDKASLPMVVNAGVGYMNTLLQYLGIYHSKNQ